MTQNEINQLLRKIPELKIDLSQSGVAYCKGLGYEGFSISNVSHEYSDGKIEQRTRNIVRPQFWLTFSETEAGSYEFKQESVPKTGKYEPVFSDQRVVVFASDPEKLLQAVKRLAEHPMYNPMRTAKLAS